MKNKYADGLRGIAAFNVAVCHFVAAFIPMALHKNYPTTFPINPSPSWQFEILTSPIFSLLYNGQFPVLIFFVISGYVLTMPYFSGRTDARTILTKRLLGRYLRLNIPIIAAIALAFFLYRFGAFANIQAADISGSGWLKGYLSNGITGFSAVKEALYESIFFGKGTLIPPLWTLRLEFIGSIYILLFYILKPRVSVITPLIIIGYFIYILHLQESIYYFSFFAGSLINYIKNPPKYKSLFFIIGLYFGAFQSNTYIYDYLPNMNFLGIDVFDTSTFYNAVGAVLITLTVSQGFGGWIFESRLFQFLGKISFSFYLIHFIVLGTLASFAYIKFPHDNFFLSAVFLIYILTCFVISIIFERFIDKKSIDISHRFSSQIVAYLPKGRVILQKMTASLYQQSTLIFVFGILIISRLILSIRLPSYIKSNMPHDDGWLVSHAVHILKGDWLGPYDQYTLIKGAFSPMLMALSAKIGVSFSGFNSALYCLACVVFVVAIRPIIKNPWLQILLLSILLFNPIPYALETGQRVYRNGIGQWEIMLIFACFIAVFLRRNECYRRLLNWVLAGGFALGVFLQTREDDLWIYPFIFGATIITVITYLLEKRSPRRKISLFLLPVVIAFLLKAATMVLNYAYYGAPIVNDRSGGNYARVASDLYAITPNINEAEFYGSEAYKDRYYSIYVSTMEKAFIASPTLNGAAPSIRTAINMWAGWENPQTGQLSTDHMLFALRDGLRSAGYYKSLPETEVFYGSVHKELEAAFESGLLSRRGFSISPLVKPLQKGDLQKALALMPSAILGIIEFNGVNTAAVPASGSEAGIKEFGLIAGGDFFTSTSSLMGSGWAFAGDDNISLIAGLYDKQGKLVAMTPFQPGEDVFIGFKSKYKNARTSRFSFKADGYDLSSGLVMRFFDKSGKLFWEIPFDRPVDGGSAVCGGSDGIFHYCIDSLKNESSVEKFYAPFIDRANSVTGLYRKLGAFMMTLGMIGYFAASILLIREAVNKRRMAMLPVWLTLTGLGLTFILFIFAMSLITATTFYALGYIYTAPAYILLLMFNSVSVAWGLNAILDFKRRRAQ